MFFFVDRARATLRDIGPAVWNGGFSTFLAIVLLAFSNSYVFKTFFKVNRGDMGSPCWVIWVVDTFFFGCNICFVNTRQRLSFSFPEL